MSEPAAATDGAIDELECIEIEPAQPARATVIWLHGLGADGNDFVPVVPELQLSPGLAVRFILPHAPVRPVTINGGMAMRSWYDILSMGSTREINEAHLRAAATAVSALIEREERRGVPSERILLVGFSQGGAVGYRAALRYPRPLAGLAALSTYRISPELAESQALPANRQLPVFIAHGESDSVVPVQLGRLACQSLQQQGFDPQWHSYPMDHEVCLPEIRALGAWIEARLTD